MSILFVRSVTLEGASVGLWRYVTPDWEKLYDSELWIDSATQVNKPFKILVNPSFVCFFFVVADFLRLFDRNRSASSIGIL